MSMAQPVPLVSIITRTKNRLSALVKAKVSIAAQSYVNIEWVVVNDGGEEISVSPLAPGLLEPMGAIVKVRYVYHEVSQGRALAAQAGLEAATGEWIGFLDDDDILYPHHIDQVVRATYDYPDSVLIYAGAKIRSFDALGQETSEKILSVEYDRNRLEIQNFIPNFTYLFPATLRTQVSFDVQMYLFEDWDFLLSISRLGDFHHLSHLAGEYTNTDSSGAHAHDTEFVLSFRERIYQKWWPTIRMHQPIDLLLNPHNPWMQSIVAEWKANWQSEWEAISRQQLQQALAEAQEVHHHEMMTKINEIHEYSQQTFDAQCLELSKVNQAQAEYQIRLEARITELEQGLQAYEHSMSWKITRPLRWLSALLRR